ncbi:MAG TPA: DUF4157 domain-containing protein [Candidatus Dormibacteraeota bacterium]|nr:DUF4157 domain-containing protein [Candidatus Dormibacteraeota bacterium]
MHARVNVPVTVKMPTPAPKGIIQRCGGHPCATGGCQYEDSELRRIPDGRQGGSVAPPIVNDVLRSPGTPLDAVTGRRLEQRFGHDFSRVRIHADDAAGESARAVGALAYTVGRHVVFAPGRYAPDSEQGRVLLGHELGHVMQQRSASDDVATSLTIGATDDPLEAEAEELARATES